MNTVQQRQWLDAVCTRPDPRKSGRTEFRLDDQSPIPNCMSWMTRWSRWRLGKQESCTSEERVWRGGIGTSRILQRSVLYRIRSLVADNGCTGRGIGCAGGPAV